MGWRGRFGADRSEKIYLASPVPPEISNAGCLGLDGIEGCLSHASKPGAGAFTSSSAEAGSTRQSRVVETFEDALKSLVAE